MQTFKDIELNPSLAQAIAELGFEKPSPIQAEALPVLLGEPTDFIGLAATGTGKTAAFGIPLLQAIDPQVKAVQALVLCPTRELGLQVSGQLNLLGKHLKVRTLPIYGGAGYVDQLRGLKEGAQIVVGTPGRLIDHIERGTLKLDQLKTVVLDEADEMISMGFREDIETILQAAPEESSNIWLFSATMSGSVRKIADDFLEKPKTVQVNRTEMLSSTVEQYYYFTQEKNKPEVLCKLIDAAEDFYGIVFCQTKALTADLTKYLNERGYMADCLHGDMSQMAREAVMTRFRSRRLRMLVCTDVAARGLDVKEITHVINYSLARELDVYVHRIGRTARSGKNGIAMSLVTPSHKHLLGRIEKMTKSRILEGVIPTRKALGIKKMARVLSTLLEQKHAGRAIEIMQEGWLEALAGMSKEEIAGRFLSMMMPEIFADDRQPQLERSPSASVRPERSERSDDRVSRAGDRRERRQDDFRPRSGGDRPERSSSESRPPRFDRPKFERSDRPERAATGDRPKFDRPKFDRPKFDRPKFATGAGDRPAPRKPHAFDRFEPKDRKPRFDREDREERPERRDRPEREFSGPRKPFKTGKPFKKTIGAKSFGGGGKPFAAGGKPFKPFKKHAGAGGSSPPRRKSP